MLKRFPGRERRIWITDTSNAEVQRQERAESGGLKVGTCGGKTMEARLGSGGR